MTFDREPDLDNANGGMPEHNALGITKNYWKLPDWVASFFYFSQEVKCFIPAIPDGYFASALYLVFCDGNPCFGVRGEN